MQYEATQESVLAHDELAGETGRTIRDRLAEIPASRYRRLFLTYLAVQDSLFILLALFIATWIRFGSLTPEVGLLVPTTKGLLYPTLFPLLLPLLMIVLYFGKLYDWDRLLWSSGELIRVVHAVTYGLIAIILFSYAAKMEGISRAWMLLFWILAVAMILMGRVLFRQLIVALRKRGLFVNRTLIIGQNAEAALLAKKTRRGATGFAPIGCLDADLAEGQPAVEAFAHLPLLGSIGNVRETIRQHKIDAVLIASSALSHRQTNDVLKAVKGLPIGVHISSGLFDIVTSRVLVKEIGGIPMTTVRPVGLGRADRFIKRAFDIGGSLALIVVLSPLMLAVGAGIKLTSRGPALFRQERVGLRGRSFKMLKFRSMVLSADDRHRDLVAAQIGSAAEEDDDMLPVTGDVGIHKIENDPRITKIGQWIRRYSIDELPQLFNVLRGEMSLVGPRPPIPYEVDMYEEWMKKRLDVTPGMTGLWQVSGRGDIPYNEMIKLDLFYIENWSLLLDVTVLLKTIPVVTLSRGAY